MSKRKALKNSPALHVSTLDYSSQEFAQELHIHDEMQILAGNSGMLEIKISAKKFNLRVGDVMIIKRRVPHSAKAILPFTSTSEIRISNDALVCSELSTVSLQLAPVFSQDENEFVYLRREDESTAEIFSTITHICEEKTRKQKGYSLFIDGYSKILLGLFDRLGALESGADSLDASAVAKLAPALLYVEENHTKEISLEEIAKTLDMNREYFCRLFKKTLGITFVDYTNLVRILSAEKLLISTQMSISEISESLGFSSVSYFTRVFKNITNITPASYRNIKIF